MVAPTENAVRIAPAAAETVILTALCGHGHFDLAAYDAYLSGEMVDEEVTDARFAAAMATIPDVPVGA
jgi:tryptophan synthase beta chain